jgi:glycosyl-4,4'-diaponeurosporenoate acyltransferase
VIEQPVPAVTALIVMWLVWSFGTGYVVHRLSDARIERWRHRLALRPWEHEGRVYERIGIRRWEDALPEAGALFRGGVSKRSIPAAADGGRLRFRRETVRAALVHWLSLVPIAWLFVLVPPVPASLNVVYALAVNAPCLVVQRFNRGRLDRTLTRRAPSRA